MISRRDIESNDSCRSSDGVDISDANMGVDIESNDSC